MSSRFQREPPCTVDQPLQIFLKIVFGSLRSKFDLLNGHSCVNFHVRWQFILNDSDIYNRLPSASHFQFVERCISSNLTCLPTLRVLFDSFVDARYVLCSFRRVGSCNFLDDSSSVVKKLRLAATRCGFPNPSAGASDGV